MRLLLYLEYRQFVNYIIMTFRTPKRLIPFLLMGAWFLMLYLPRLMLPASDHTVAPPFPGERAPQMPTLHLPEFVPAIVFVLLSLLMIYQIIRSFSESLIVFGMPDIDFLFPSPISRRAIMALKLLSLYARVGAYVVFFVFIFIPQLKMAFHSDGSVFITWVAASLFAAFIVNISTAINLVSNFHPGGRWWLSYAVRGSAAGLLLLALGSFLYIGLSTGNYLNASLRVATSPILTTILMPARWTADLLLSSIIGWRPGLGNELGMMALLAAVTFGLVITRKENPYEPSLAVSARAARIRSAQRMGGFARIQTEMLKEKLKSAGAKSAVMPFGRGAMAIVWKNLNISVRNSRSVWIAVPILIAGVLIGARIAFPGAGTGNGVEIAATVILAYLSFFSSMFMLQAFRSDLKMANIMKPMPIPSWQIVAAQCVQGTLIVALLAWTVTILVALIFGLSPNSFLLLGALTLPVVVYSLLSWEASASIIYPRWEDPTQQYLGGLIGMAAAGIALGPPVVAGVVGHLLHLGTAPVALAVNVIAAGMAAIGIAASGHLYSRFDPTDE